MSDEHLAHGWEAAAPDERSVLRSFVLSTADTTAWVTERVGGRVGRWDDLAAADPASPIFFDNFAVLLAPPAYGDLDDVLARLTAFYPPDRHFALLSVWPTPDLTADGFALMGHPPFMVRAAGGVRPPVPDGLTIVEATDAATLADALTVLGEGFGFPADGSPAGDPRVLGGPVRVWVGYADGRAVSTAAARLGHGIVDVEAVATLPDCQGRGYGEALTWEATLADSSLPAVLYSSDAGRAIYERMGYLPLFRLTLWHRPPAEA
ncbi:GNAT family N-acetyltransferase [Sporichthya polymorpha]|uniref:GNAT family N-acetyltransferase n=1 Tax=Sporichthya polymorpha TaxID=35751 RepID=UPI00037566AA|nr:GNAT family N-acetyltransferase [Sporichthya polymorpha]